MFHPLTPISVPDATRWDLRNVKTRGWNESYYLCSEFPSCGSTRRGSGGSGGHFLPGTDRETSPVPAFWRVRRWASRGVGVEGSQIWISLRGSTSGDPLSCICPPGTKLLVRTSVKWQGAWRRDVGGKKHRKEGFPQGNGRRRTSN